jgi:peroxiredoxin
MQGPYSIKRRICMKLKVGQKAPNFTLPSHLEKKVTLKKCLGKGPVVIAFFPLAWTPV